VAQQPTHLVVGHVSRAHGTRGEVYVSPLTDHPESVFAPGVVLRVAADEGEKPDPKQPPLRIDAVRPFRDGLLVTFDAVPDRNAAERLHQRYLVAPLSDLAELADDELFYHQLLGMRVRTVDGTEIGQGAQPSNTVRSLISKARLGGDESVALGEVDVKALKAKRSEMLAERRAKEKSKAAEKQAAPAAQAAEAAEGSAADATEEAEASAKPKRKSKASAEGGGEA
jgi:16S rRNA processing protein RimM